MIAMKISQKGSIQCHCAGLRGAMMQRVTKNRFSSFLLRKHKYFQKEIIFRFLLIQNDKLALKGALKMLTRR